MRHWIVLFLSWAWRGLASLVGRLGARATAWRRKRLRLVRGALLPLPLRPVVTFLTLALLLMLRSTAWAQVSTNFDGGTSTPAGWSLDNSVIGTANFQSSPNGTNLCFAGSTGHLSYNTADAWSGNIVLRVKFIHLASGGTFQMFSRLSSQTWASNNGYGVEFPVGTSLVRLLKRTGGTPATLGTGIGGTSTLATSVWYEGWLTINGTSIKADVQRLSDSKWLQTDATFTSNAGARPAGGCVSATDSTYTGSGYFGCLGFVGSSGITIDDVLADTAVAAASFTITPDPVYTHATSKTLTLVGTGTSWTGSTTFTASGVAGCTTGTVTVTDSTHATVLLTTGSATGTLTITEGVTGTAATTMTVSQATFTRSPTSIVVSTTGNVVTLTGTGTNWTGSPFSLTGGTGASITAQSVTNTTNATVTITAGSATGTLTLSDTDGNSVTITVTAAAILADNAAIYYSPGNVRIDSTAHEAWFIENGPYMKFNFTGTSLTFTVDLAVYKTNSIAQAAWGYFIISVDGGAFAKKTITDPGAPTTQTVTMASSLTNTTHQCVVFWIRGTETDMWTPTQACGLTQITLASGSDTLATGTGFAAPLTRKIMVFGDSITTAYRAYNPDATIAIYTPAGFPYLLGRMMGAEVGITGYSAQGWSTGGSGAPSLGSTLNKYDSTHTRTWPTGLTAVFLCEGTNDGSTDVSATIQTQIANVRGYVGANCWIVVVPAFTGTGAAFQKLGVSNYQTANSSDLKVTCISFADWMAIAPYTANVDGTHPDGPGHAQIAALLAQQSNALGIIGSTTTSGTKRKVQ